MQGSGTFVVESVISSLVPRDGKLLVAINGAYGRRMAEIAKTLAIETEVIIVPEAQPVAPTQIENVLVRDPAITHVGMVHCETTTGILNPVEEVGRIARRLQRTFIVDAMSSFGGMPMDIRGCGIDLLVSSANKCIQGVPGFVFVLARRALLLYRGRGSRPQCRSEEHTSELQSLTNLVCRLLLEKKKHTAVSAVAEHCATSDPLT